MKNPLSGSIKDIIAGFNKIESNFEKSFLITTKSILSDLEIEDAACSIITLNKIKALICMISRANSAVFVLFTSGEQATAAQSDTLLRLSRTNASVFSQAQPQKIYCACVPVQYSGKPELVNFVHIIPPEVLNDYILALFKNEPQDPPVVSAPVMTHDHEINRQQQIDDYCQENSQEWATAVVSGFLSDAREVSEKLRRASFSLRITSDFDTALRYLKARDINYSAVSSAPVREAKPASSQFKIISADPLNETLLTEPDGHDNTAFTVLYWGNDMKWAGKWKFNKLMAGLSNPTMQVYLKMLSLSSRGILIYVQNTAEMVATKRALMDCGVLPLD